MVQKTVTLRFDDALASHWTEARPRLTEYGFPGVLAVPTNHIDKPDHLTFAQLTVLQHFEWDICSHSMTHPHMMKLTPAQMDLELEGSKEWLQKHGFRKGARFFIMPYVERSPTLDVEVKKYYIPADQGAICLAPKGMSADRLNTEIDAALLIVDWITIVFHDLVSTVGAYTWEYPLAEFQKILDHIHHERLRVVTFSDKIGELEKWKLLD